MHLPHSLFNRGRMDKFRGVEFRRLHWHCLHITYDIENVRIYPNGLYLKVRKLRYDDLCALQNCFTDFAHFVNVSSTPAWMIACEIITYGAFVYTTYTLQ